MKVFVISMLLLLSAASFADAREYSVQTTTPEFLVEASIDNYPLVLGDNRIDVTLSDHSGKHITDAEVLVNYYMPPMPRMVPMNYKTEASSKSSKYRATMNIIMAGPWYIKIVIRHDGKISTAKFNVDAQ